MNTIDKELEVARNGLLDLTMRNQLLNFRPSKSKTIKVVDEIPKEIYSHLVIQEKKMEFTPTHITQSTSSIKVVNSDQPDASNTDTDLNDTSILWEMPEPDSELDSKYTDRFLQTSLKSEDLQKRMYYISKQSQSVLEEQGYTVLYLALGFLEWEEKQADILKLRQAPLILVPVDLVRTAVHGPFQLSWTGEDIFTNISLQAKLKEYGISLPDFEMPEDKEGIDQYLQEVLDAVAKKPNWKVFSDINLSFFSFTKFVMYKDLDPVAWPKDNSPSEHPLITKIFNPEPQTTDNQFSEAEVDKRIKSNNVYHVMDADPSQIAVIEDVKSGSNIVVEGPPGTGKSQTITNIIAEILATGKTVLFVSEKMAALEVVKTRLDQAGLGDFCLELHSKKAKKKEVLKELERTLSLPAPKSISLDNDFRQLESLKQELNDYASALREPFGIIGQSPFSLFCMKEDALRYFENVGRDMPSIKLANIEKCSHTDWTEAIAALSNISDVLPLVKPINNNPWRGCKPGIVLPSDEYEIKEMLDGCKESLDTLNVSLDSLSSLSSAKLPLNIDEVEPFISASKIIASSRPIEKEVLLNESWDKEPKATAILIEKVKDFQDQMSVILSIFTENTLEEDIKSIVMKYNELHGKYPIIQYFNNNCTSHPWKTSAPKNILSSDELEIETLIDKCKLSLLELKSTIHQLCENASIHQPFTIEEIGPSISAARVVAASKPVDKEVLLNKEWNEQSSKANSLIKKVESFQKQRLELSSSFKENAFNEDIDSIAREYKELSSKFFIVKLFSGRYRYLKNEISSLYKNVSPKKTETVISDLNDLSACLRSRKDILESSSIGQSLFGSHWKDEESDPEMLESFAEWIVSFRKQLLKDAFSNKVVDKVSSGVSKEGIEKIIDQLNTATENFLKQQENLARAVGISSNSLFSISSQSVTFENIEAQLDSWKGGIIELHKWMETTGKFYRIASPEKAEIVLSDLNKVLRCTESQREIRDLNESGLSFFGSYWKSENSEPQILESLVEWMISFRQHLLSDLFDEQVFEKITSGVSKVDLEDAIEDVIQNVNLFVGKRDMLLKRLNFNSELLSCTSLEATPFKQTDLQLQSWQAAIPNLQKWGQFTVRRDQCLETLALPLIELIDADLIEVEDIIPCFEGNFAENLLRSVFIERKTLASFMGELHEKKISSFTELDRKLIIENRQRLARLLYERQPSIVSGVSPKSEAGILVSEFNRKRNHMPIRQLMRNAGGFIQKIKPCFMMSPLSIAQFLDPLNVSFDVVVFDEASQVKPEDALGALLRAKQCVIIGDTRQLPPTSFFDNIIEDESEEDIVTPLSDIESILHLCKRSFLTKNLRWHYRSRHESLIAVSNQEFYDQRLVIYPSPMADIEHLGLKFIHLPDTVYDRGKTSVNRKEAKIVAKSVFDHFKEYPDKSLGVGTFNIKQQQAIQEEVDMLLMSNPDMNEFFDSKRPDHFFVKNLETIQGDERDVIFISMGYGFDANKNLSLNFGPLNREGGERRLNVLITRAREKCIVFSNFKSKDLTINQSAAFGLKALKVFLDFAENRNLYSINAEKDTNSAFEESVHEFLCGCGYKVEKQVGCAGYRVDIGIVDPKSPGRYLVGIECDGPKYHLSSVARDRDRLRQQVLENLGWTIYRIWSTDWYRNKNECQMRLQEFTEKMRARSSEPSTTTQKVLQNPYQTNESVVVREQIDKEQELEKSLSDLVPEYQICTRIDIDTTEHIHELSPSALGRAIIQVLETESPVHVDEVIKRIRENHGSRRTGNKIRDAILKAVDYCEKTESIVKKNDFLWKSRCGTAKVRRRGNGVPAKIELICDEEIAEAIRLILKIQHATSINELVVQTSRLLGFKSTSEMVAERIRNVINGMVGVSNLRVLSNGMVDLISERAA